MMVKLFDRAIAVSPLIYGSLAAQRQPPDIAGDGSALQTRPTKRV
jgi:hypothetical protein